MRCGFLYLISLCLFVAAGSAQAQPQNTYYVDNGTTLQAMYDNPAHANGMRWQVWLFEEGARVPHPTSGLTYSRWGLIEGVSAESVMKQLEAFQRFESAYLKFFGPGTWSRYTFFNFVGPIAITDRAVETKLTALETLSQLDVLCYRVKRLITTVQPSLEINENEGPYSPHKEYFDQVQDALEIVSKLYSQLYRQLAHARPQLQFIERVIAQANAAVAQAENNVPKITAALPSVKLPTSNAWMSHTEWAGSDGTIQVVVEETGSGTSVHQTWTGGKGSMTGTVMVTTIPFEDIRSVDVEPPTRGGDNTWTVRVQSALTSFPQTVTSPQRKTARGLLNAFNYKTTESVVYLVFLNSAEAQDAYAYFQYHKQLRR